MSFIEAVVDGIVGEDDRIAGQAFSRVTAVLSAGETTSFTVESTLGFGEWADGLSDGLLLINGEIVYVTGRTDPLTFTGLSRGFLDTPVQNHPVGTLVYDLSGNTSALDHVRRGFLVDFAVGEDLDVIGRNLGLIKCVGITDEEWRAIIKAIAYLPKTTTDAFTKALDALWGSGNYTIQESPAAPWQVCVDVLVGLSTTLQGRFMLNGGEPQLTTGANTVDTTYPILSPTLAAYPGSPNQTLGLREHTYPAGAVGTAIVGVYDDTPETRRGTRDGFTNYFLGGSVLGNTVTLGTSPGGIGTAVIVDYTAFSAHYLAENEATFHADDFYAYLSDPLLATRCLLEQIRAAGIHVEVRAKV